jgi:hypothetical protein
MCEISALPPLFLTNCAGEAEAKVVETYNGARMPLQPPTLFENSIPFDVIDMLGWIPLI